MNDSRALLAALKLLLRQRGVTYQNLADRLEVSVATVKRMLSTRSAMTLERFDQICAVLETDLGALARLAAESEAQTSGLLSLEQESALAADIKLYLLFYGLVKGTSWERMTEVFTITHDEATQRLRQLDRLGLIELHPGDRAKLTAPRFIEWHPGGPLETLYEQQMRVDFLAADFRGPFDLLRRVGGPLSETSIARLHQRLGQLADEVKDLARLDALGDRGAQKPIYTLLVGFREWMPSVITKLLRPR